ncbi:hypothetical protein ACFVDH_22025 [Streptomyces sp. NPDC057674]|uniref:hypothetical protein n=1 Tax=Streptomyces sp. NPDC057674 TaxID=3346203 RepID=UPI003695C8E4
MTENLPPTEPCTDPRHTGRIREQLGCTGPDPRTPPPVGEQPSAPAGDHFTEAAIRRSTFLEAAREAEAASKLFPDTLECAAAIGALEGLSRRLQRLANHHTTTEHCGHQPDPVIGQPTECVLRPGHSGSHADHTGMRWWMRKLPDPGPANPSHAEADLARLREGEEPHTGTAPLTPGQWIWSYNRATASQRLDIAARILANAETTEACFFGAHTATIERLQHRATDTQSAYTQAMTDLGRVIGRHDAALSVAQTWHAYFTEQNDAPATHALSLVLKALATGETS